MSKFLRYVGKYDKLDYKNHVFFKGRVEEVDDNIAELIMSKGYLSTQFELVSNEQVVIEEVPVVNIDVDDVLIEMQEETPPIEAVDIIEVTSPSKSKKSKKRWEGFNEDSNTNMQDEGERTSSD